MAQMTQERYEKLKKELEYLKGERQNEVSEHLKEARAFGDISENAEYDAAQNEQAELQAEIKRVQEEINNAEIVDYSKLAGDTVNIGSKVRLNNITKGKEEEFQIVVASDADVFSGLISNESPVGAALVGAKKGDKVEVELPSGNKVNYEVLDIKAE
jgi:transcription elongation factor GreA